MTKQDRAVGVHGKRMRRRAEDFLSVLDRLGHRLGKLNSYVDDLARGSLAQQVHRAENRAAAAERELYVLRRMLNCGPQELTHVVLQRLLDERREVLMVVAGSPRDRDQGVRAAIIEQFAARRNANNPLKDVAGEGGLTHDSEFGRNNV